MSLRTSLVACFTTHKSISFINPALAREGKKVAGDRMLSC
ncbi:Uncharacterised protein [Vibrio cholerae]|nr:Uncharacterised protein [Vibrio cholerae]CSI53349.1 Uncharacterised protein [Vibrio cholerae]CSI56394.1 Uncharacterised protein [Vibrio cholerae]